MNSIFINKEQLLKVSSPHVISVVIALSTLSYSTIGKASINSLWEDGEFHFSSINQTYGRNDDGKEHWHESAGGLDLGFSSGFYGADFLSLGFGVSGQVAYSLGNSNASTVLKNDSGLLPQTGCDENTKECEGFKDGYAKLSEAYVKYKVGSTTQRYGIGEIGLGYFGAGLLVNFAVDGDPILPMSFQGTRFNGVWDGWKFSAVYINGIKKGAQTKVYDLYVDKNFDRTTPRLDYITSLGVYRTIDNTKLTLELAAADGYKTRSAFAVSHDLNLGDESKLTFGFGYTMNRYNGENWDQLLYSGAEDKDQDNLDLGSVRIGYAVNNWNFNLAHSWITGDRKNYDRFMAAVPGKSYQYATGFVEKFRLQGARSYAASASYDLSTLDLPVIQDLYLNYKFVYGDTQISEHNPNGAGNGYEHALLMRYFIPSETLKGSSITFRAGHFYGDGTPDLRRFMANVIVPIW